MKKLLLTFLTTLCLLIPCFTITGCNSNKYAGTQYKLTDVTAVYENTVDDSVKTKYENLIQKVKEKIDGEEAPYCKFYSVHNVFVTNCSGKIRLGYYKSNGSKLSIDLPTSKTATKDKSKIITRFLLSSELENAEFANENKNISLTEHSDGVTVKYVFAPDGELNESPTDYNDSTYKIADVSYCSFPDNESENALELEGATNCLKYSMVSFRNSYCYITGRVSTYDYKQDNPKNEHLIDVGYAESDYWGIGSLFAYGDLILWVSSIEGGYGKIVYLVRTQN